MNFDGWEIVHAGFGESADGFIGRVVGENPVEVALLPIYAYSSTTFIAPVTDAEGAPVLDENGQQRMAVDVKRIVLPMEMMGSMVAERIRWTRRRKVSEYRPEDQAVFGEMVARAEALAESKRPRVAIAGPGGVDMNAKRVIDTLNGRARA